MARLGLAALTGAAVAAAGAASAHPHGHGAEAGAPALMGLLHPLTGLDHLLAMVAVGLWAALSGGRAVWALPAGFVAAMLAGFGLGAAGVALPAVEPVILASVIVIGAAVAVAFRPPLAVALALVALFGLAHGHAHGTEGPATGLALYAVGFATATVALHLAGLLVGLTVGRAGSVAPARALGIGIAVAGLALAATAAVEAGPAPDTAKGGGAPWTAERG